MTIKNISWAYVGWVDMERVGFEGIPIDARHHTKEFLATPFKSIEELALLMDPLGYDALYATEHHFQPEGIEVFPNMQILFVHLAQLTKNIRFGCAFNILPQWHPLRLAEDYAMADILTRGRVIFGVARGSQSRELATFGAPLHTQEENRALFEEQVEILLKALRDERFSHHGKNYDLPPPVQYRTYKLEQITLVPRPIHPVEMWQAVVTGTPRALEFMAAKGIKPMFVTAKMSAPDPTITAFEAIQSQRQGQERGYGAYLYCHLGSSKTQAAREVEKFQEEAFKRATGIGGGPTDDRGYIGQFKITMEGQRALGHPATARQAAKEMGYLPLETLVAEEPAYLFGTPQEVIGTLKEMERRYPNLETVLLHPPEMTHVSILKAQIKWFAEAVLPAFPAAIKKNRTWPDKLADVSKLPRYVEQPAY